MANHRASKILPSAQPFLRSCRLRLEPFFAGRLQPQNHALSLPADLPGRHDNRAAGQVVGLLIAAFLLMPSPPSRAEGGSHWRIFPLTAGRGGTFPVAVTVSPRGNVWVRQGGDGPASWLDGFHVRTIPFLGTGNFP